MAGIVAAEARGVRYSVAGVEVLRDVSLMVFKGEVTALLGHPEGDLVLGLWAGVWRPVGGSVAVLGFDPHVERRALAGRVGYIPPDFWLPPELGAETLAGVVGGGRGLLHREAVERLRNILKRLGRQDVLGRRISELSAEGRCLVAVALAMLNDPELLLLSNPLKTLGPLARLELSSLLREYVSPGRAVALTVASVEEASFADRLILFRDGRVAAAGPLDELSKTIGAENYLVLQAVNVQRTVDYLGKMPQVKRFSVAMDGSIKVWLRDFESELPLVLDLLLSLGLGVKLVDVRRVDYHVALLNYLRGRGAGGR
ncbi:MAG: ATP-binding cassette domain-containing protein [Nitrososphaerota archaeon]|nr:ATP-binding cassette domain-containing protein [Candidatus Calditenuaceae archaeon]MDW8074035.1 ATP-binding cassette domain-containing protein [Nitrososphaerota archaeon]